MVTKKQADKIDKIFNTSKGKANELLKSMKDNRQVEKKTPIATNMFLPNHSGIASHPEFKKAISGISGGAVGNLDGGNANSIYGGISPLNGGGA